MILQQKGTLKETIPDFDRFCEFVSEFKEIVDTGKLAEFYCIKLFGLKKIGPFNNKGPDLESIDGKIKFEIKYRKVNLIKNKLTPPGMEIDLENIDYVLYVYLDEKSLLPRHISQISKEDIDYTKNGKRVSFNRAFKENKEKTIFQS